MHYWQHCSVFWGRDKMSGFCSLKTSLRTIWWFLPFLPITVKIKHELIECAVRRTYCVEAYWLPWWFWHLWSKLCFRYFMSFFVLSNISLWEHLNYVKPNVSLVPLSVGSTYGTVQAFRVSSHPAIVCSSGDIWNQRWHIYRHVKFFQPYK